MMMTMLQLPLLPLRVINILRPTDSESRQSTSDNVLFSTVQSAHTHKHRQALIGRAHLPFQFEWLHCTVGTNAAVGFVVSVAFI